MASSRRTWLIGSSQGLLASTLLAGCSSNVNAQVVIIGGGFAGASCAKVLKRLDPTLEVTLVEPNKVYTACPFSNLVVSGLRRIEAQQFGYDALRSEGITVIHQQAVEVDPISQQVTLAQGDQLSYDRLVMSPGISIDWQALAGYDQSAAQIMPHAWQAGSQTLLLRDQLHSMPEDGLVTMAVPASPYRCPPGPYERASLIAHYLKQHKPKAKLLVLDAKDQFSKQRLFTQAWQSHYPGLLEWQGASDGASVVSVDADNMTLHTDFDSIKADVSNVIPPQKAGLIAQRADLTDASGWCPIKAQTFESTRHKHVYVIGDAAIANAMPKSAFAANAQAKLCAVQIVRGLADQSPVSTKLVNTCYSLVTPKYGISVVGVYRADDAAWRPIAGAGGTSDEQASDAHRQLEAEHASAWYAQITGQVFQQLAI